MLTRLIREEGVRKRLLTFFDGERRLTNLVQLSEILHRESLQNRKGMNGLLNWMRGQMAADAAGGEAYELRLESDAPAVTITTIHRSKGLEYPVVFCPFLWDRPHADSGEIQFHDPQHDHRITLDLGSDRFSEHRELAVAEMLAENLRILYVALTRAKDRCYLVWGNTRHAEQSAFGYLLLDTGEGGSNVIGQGEAEGCGTGSSIRSALRRLEDRSEGHITVRSIPDPVYLRYAPADREEAPLRCTEFNGRIQRDWRISSFSAMVSEYRDDIGSRDHDLIAGLESVDGEKRRGAVSPDPGTVPSIFDFPKGARAGTFFHEIFERIDFSQPGGSALEKEIAAALERYGYALNWQATVLHMVENVLRLPLIGPQDSFSLQQVENAKRINEMAFTFPMAAFDTAALGDILRGCPAEIKPEMPEFIENIGKLRLSQPGGYMKGFVDLVFVQNDRYYIVDWKSNHLGDQAADYQGEKIRAAMASHYYPLQYHIYTLALHLMLKQRIPGYRYDRHFGGVWYIFIRGVSGDTEPVTGIFQDRPDISVIEALESLMIPAAY